MKVAKKFEGKTVFFAIASTDDFSPELNEFGMQVSDDGKPIVAARDASNQKFIMTQEFS